MKYRARCWSVNDLSVPVVFLRSGSEAYVCASWVNRPERRTWRLQWPRPCCRGVRCPPPRKDRPVTFSLSSISCAADAAKASASQVAAVSSGEITPSEAVEIGRLLENYALCRKTSASSGRPSRQSGTLMSGGKLTTLGKAAVGKRATGQRRRSFEASPRRARAFAADCDRRTCRMCGCGLR